MVSYGVRQMVAAKSSFLLGSGAVQRLEVVQHSVSDRSSFTEDPRARHQALHGQGSIWSCWELVSEYSEEVAGSTE